MWPHVYSLFTAGLCFHLLPIISTNLPSNQTIQMAIDQIIKTPPTPQDWTFPSNQLFKVFELYSWRYWRCHFWTRCSVYTVHYLHDNHFLTTPLSPSIFPSWVTSKIMYRPGNKTEPWESTFENFVQSLSSFTHPQEREF